MRALRVGGLGVSWVFVAFKAQRGFGVSSQESF